MDRSLRIAALVLALLKLWFVAAQPLTAVAGAWHDDRLFVWLAERIAHGEWLGEYNNLTLAKGCGYPLFIAGAFKLGIPLPIAEATLYLVASWLLVRALRPLLRHEAWALALFSLLAWQPMSFTVSPPVGGTVLRQNLYTPLTLLLFAGLIALHTRRAAAPWSRAGWAVLLGASAGWFWIVREESVWIGPSVALLLACAAVSAWRERSFARLFWPLGLAGVIAAAPVVTVCSLNARHYGWFGTCEFRAPEFVAAYGSLLRLRAGETIERVPVTRAMRRLAYAASPTLAQWRDLIEGEITRRWTGGDDREINGGMWMWAFRDAVAEGGKIKNAREALGLYRQIAEEVNASCDAGRVPASPRRDSFLPRWNALHTATAKADWLRFARIFFGWEGFKARPSPGFGDAGLMQLFEEMTRWHLTPSAEAPHLSVSTPSVRALRAWRIGALHDIGTVLCRVLPWLAAVGGAAWLWSGARALRARRAPGYAWWMATAALGGALAVVVIAFLVHVTSWADGRTLRFAQAYPLILLFAALAIADAFRAAENETSPAPTAT